MVSDDSIERTKQRIRGIIAGSAVPEDPRHAENTLQWLLRLTPDADQTLQIAALGHDIDRAIEARKVRRADFDDYDVFKAAHARNGARILGEIMVGYAVPSEIADEVYRLVCRHEVGGDAQSDLLKDADSISYFDVNLPLYYARHGWAESKRRCLWGCRRLSPRMRRYLRGISHHDASIDALLSEVLAEVSAER